MITEENKMIEFLEKQEKRLRDLEDHIGIIDTKMIAFLDKQEKRIQGLEDHLAENSKKPEPDEKTSEEEKFIKFMKSINSSVSSNKIDSEDDEDEFIKTMKGING